MVLRSPHLDLEHPQLHSEIISLKILDITIIKGPYDISFLKKFFMIIYTVNTSLRLFRFGNTVKFCKWLFFWISLENFERRFVWYLRLLWSLNSRNHRYSCYMVSVTPVLTVISRDGHRVNSVSGKFLFLSK